MIFSFRTLTLSSVFILTACSQIAQETPTFKLSQHSYSTTCAEEDNVMIKFSAADSQLTGVNIQVQKPVFEETGFKIHTDPDFSGCHWQPKTLDSKNFYPECRVNEKTAGYIDESGKCQPEQDDILFENEKWQVLAYRGANWQPFMQVFSPSEKTQSDKNVNNHYKILTFLQKQRIGGIDELQVVAALYSDGYFRPVYFARTGEPSGWGGSFVLGAVESVHVVAERFYNLIKEVRVVPSAEGLVLDLIFADTPNKPARLVLHDDWSGRGIDFMPAERSGTWLTFASMYRDAESFDIEFVEGNVNGKRVIYEVLSKDLAGAEFVSSVGLVKRKPSIHNTLAPDFVISGIVER